MLDQTTIPIQNAHLFWAKVEKTATCWLWTGALMGGGYGLFMQQQRGGTRYVHRLAYEALVGVIPQKLVIDHLCRVRNCVNPDHLEVVTRGENVRRGEGIAAKTRRLGVCQRGHAMEPGSRYCVECHRDWQARNRGRYS